MGIYNYNQPLYTPGTDPYFLKLFYVLDTQQYEFHDFKTFSGFSVNLVLVEKIATRTFQLSECTLHKHLGHIFWRVGILAVDERSAPPAAETSQHSP